VWRSRLVDAGSPNREIHGSLHELTVDVVPALGGGARILRKLVSREYVLPHPLLGSCRIFAGRYTFPTPHPGRAREGRDLRQLGS